MQNTVPETAINDLDASLASLAACRYNPEEYKKKSQLVLDQLMDLKKIVAENPLQDFTTEMENLYNRLLYEFVFSAKSAVFRTPGLAIKVDTSRELNTYRQGWQVKVTVSQ